MYLCVKGIDIATIYDFFFLLDVGTVPTVQYFRTVPTAFYKMKNKKYQTVGTVLKYHTVGTVLKYQTVGTVLKYHTVGTVLKYHTVRTVLKSVVF
jgi:hypothetical protein